MNKNYNLTNVLLIITILFSHNAFAVKLDILTEHLAPFQIVKANEIEGISSEIVKATLNESQYTYNLASYPWSVTYNQALKEANTCIYSLARIPDRESLFQWIGKIVDSNTSFYALKSNPVDINHFDDARKYKIAVIKDDVTHHFLLSKGFIENEQFYVMNNYEALLKLLEIPSRNIDLVILNDDLLSYRVKHSKDILKYKKIITIDELALNFHLACSLKTEKNIVNHLIDSMKTLENNGVLSTIRSNWQKHLVNIL